MPKTKSSRATVRKSPQPKTHSYIPAVFADDFGRDRALTVQSAKQFSGKKLDAASRALQQRSDRAMDKAIEAGDRETGRAIRRLRRQERASDLAIKRFFMRVVKTTVRPSKQIKHKPPKKMRMIMPSRPYSLPKYDGPIRDRFGRRGVFARFRYYSARTAKPGVSKRVTIYIFKGAALDEDGKPMIRTNVGETIDETVCGFDHLEQVSWSAQKGAKILNHAVLAMDYRWTPEEMLEVGEQWAQERFGRYGLPYCVSLHAPPPGGDERNWHLHVTWSWRPFERIGDHEWLVGENLRTDLDGAKGMLVLRERFAALMTAMSFQTGNLDEYTALSYAARGLPHEPQIHLDEGRTRRVRAGEFVPANEENHERVMRSKTAAIDDDLRREDERLAQKQQIERRVRNRFAKTLSIPVMPIVRFMPAKISLPVEEMKVQTLRLAKRWDIPTGAIARLARLADGASSSWRRERANDKQSGIKKIANLRLSKAAIGNLLATPNTLHFSAQSWALVASAPALRPTKIANAIPAPATYSASKFTVPGIVAPPRLAALSPVLKAPPARPVFSSVKIANLRAADPPRFAVPIHVESLPNPSAMTRAAFNVSAVQTVLRLAAPIASLPNLPFRSPTFAKPAVSTLATAGLSNPLLMPTVPSLPNFRFGQLKVHFGINANRAEIMPLIADKTRARLARQIAKAADAISLDREQEERENARRKVRIGEETADTLARSRLLLDLLDEQRYLIRKDKAGRLTVPAQLNRQINLSVDEVASDHVQEVLSIAVSKQQAELESIGQYVSRNPNELFEYCGSWRLRKEAPEDIKRALFSWRSDEQVQKTVDYFSKLSPVADDTAEIDRRERAFKTMVFGSSEHGDPVSRREPERLQPQGGRQGILYCQQTT